MTTETYIVIKRTITLTQRVLFDSNHYPDCETPEDGAEYERNLDLQEKVEAFVSGLEFSEPGDFEFREEVTIESVNEENEKTSQELTEKHDWLQDAANVAIDGPMGQQDEY